MEALPCNEPEESIDSESYQAMDAFIGLVGKHVEQLSDEHRFVIEGLFYERLSLRRMGLRLNRDKNAVARLRDEALSRLRDLLISDESIAEKFGDHTEGHEARPQP